MIVFNSLSKRSGLAGLRSGFIAGDPEIVSRVRRHRSDVGTTPQAFVQLASIAADSAEAVGATAQQWHWARRLGITPIAKVVKPIRSANSSPAWRRWAA